MLKTAHKCLENIITVQTMYDSIPISYLKFRGCSCHYLKLKAAMLQIEKSLPLD